MAATFMEADGAKYGEPVEEICFGLFMTRYTIYKWYPNKLRTDQGFVFTSERWKQKTDTSGIQLRLSGVRSYSSLGIGKRYHEPLPQTYKK